MTDQVLLTPSEQYMLTRLEKLMPDPDPSILEPDTFLNVDLVLKLGVMRLEQLLEPALKGGQASARVVLSTVAVMSPQTCRHLHEYYDPSDASVRCRDCEAHLAYKEERQHPGHGRTGAVVIHEDGLAGAAGIIMVNPDTGEKII